MFVFRVSILKYIYKVIGYLYIVYFFLDCNIKLSIMYKIFKLGELK